MSGPVIRVRLYGCMTYVYMSLRVIFSYYPPDGVRYKNRLVKKPGRSLFLIANTLLCLPMNHV